MTTKVLCTSVPGRDRPALAKLLPDAAVVAAPLSDGLVAAHPDVEVLSVMIHDPVSQEVLAGLPRLRGIVTRSTGYDHLPLDALARRGITACHLPDYAVPGVAHLTLGFILGLLRRLPEALTVTQGARRGGQGAPSWAREALVGRHLHDVRVGVLGTGRIGSEVVRLLCGLGATVRGYDIAPDPVLAKVRGFRYVDSFAALVAASDVLTVHVPLSRSTRGLINGPVLAALPGGAILVNTARGEIVDQRAVAAALADGHLGGYAADVLPGEPDPPELRLFEGFHNVLLTPHLGAYDKTSIRLRYEHTAAAVRALLADDEAVIARFRVLPEAFSPR